MEAGCLILDSGAGPFHLLNLLRSFIHILATMLFSIPTNIVRLGPDFKLWENGNIARSSHIPTLLQGIFLSRMARSQLSSTGRWLDGIQSIGSILVGQRVILGLHEGGWIYVKKFWTVTFKNLRLMNILTAFLLAVEFVLAEVNIVLVSSSDIVPRKNGMWYLKA